ncbi:hypothetical protein ACIO52_21575 [Nocardia sp. NPDC087230]|uniref:hypothetical protein n=1 Tax=Nocardia sp. NPDC087230 TaxID=3364331 RepID=UPI003818620F
MAPQFVRSSSSFEPPTGHTSFDARVADAVAAALIPAREVIASAEEIDYEAWDHVGDPLGEALIADMRARNMMKGDLIANARTLRDQGIRSAVDFLAEVEYVPSWLNFDELQDGVDWAARNPIGFALGFHGALPWSYLDSHTAAVFAATGRLRDGGDYSRRLFETARGFISTFDVEGMKPGGQQWETWVRVRLMHTMVRIGLQRSGKWTLDGVPVSSLSLGAGVFLFGWYRAAIAQWVAGPTSRREIESWMRMWQWVARLQGAPVECIQSSLDVQRDIDARILGLLYRPDAQSKALVAANYRGLSETTGFRALPLKAHEAIGWNLLKLPASTRYGGLRVPEELGLRRHKLLTPIVAAMAAGLRFVHQIYRIPLVRRRAASAGIKFMAVFVERGLAGKDADFRTHVLPG